MYKKYIPLIFFCGLSLSLVIEANQAVTYELSPGRFGDNLLSYIHAKWISYKHKIPVLYKPFIYSDALKIHECESLYTESKKNSFHKMITLGKKVSVQPDSKASVLYLVPYFPESKWELKNCISFKGGSWDYIEIDWNDQEFIKELRKVIAPRRALLPMNLPKDCVTVAVHIRRGGNHDTPETLPSFPLKFLPDDFYIEQIKKIYFLLKEKRLYVYLFTDDNNPQAIARAYKNYLKNLAIEIDCRKEKNSDTTNVLEDFFALQQFDCLIHSESNFSFIMSKMHEYLISIYPSSFHKENNKIMYDTINVTVRM